MKLFTQQINKTTFVFLLGVMLLIVLAACRTSEDQDESAGATPAGNDESEAAPLPDQAGTTGTRQSAVDAPLPSFDMVSLDQSLAVLASYRLLAELSFSGESSAGVPLEWTVIWESAKSAEPPASRLDIQPTGLGPSSELSSLSLARIEGETYLALAGSGCLTGDDINYQAGAASSMNPDLFLAGLNGAVLAAEDQIANGLPSALYSFDEKMLSTWQDDSVEVDGQIYVANNGGFVDKVELTAVGMADFAGLSTPQNGTFQLQVDVIDVNEPLQIQPPLACINTSDIPMPVEAVDVAYFEDMIFYRSKLPLTDLAAFYTTEMPQTDWILLEEGEVFEDSAVLTYGKGDTQISIYLTLSADGSQTEVIIAP